jgi:ubiquinone/menaquinone biosynthesis C-methylase UbiE
VPGSALGLGADIVRSVSAPSEDPTDPGLAPTTVPPSEYDADYYLKACMGADVWRESEGAEAHALYGGMLDHTGFEPGMRLLDLGTGRGELLAVAISRGAAEAVGVDYSEAAIELAQTTLAKAGDPPGAAALLADARRLPVPDRHFDRAMMLDVVEHLTVSELELALSEARRALKPGGRLFIHTAPNRLIYEVTYRIQRSLVPSRRRRWPADPRQDEEHRMHPNEQSVGSLKRVLQEAGYEGVRVWPGRWVYTDFVPEPRARATYRRLARIPGLRRIAICDIYATGARPASAVE